MFVFFLFISLFINQVDWIDRNPPEYLPLDLSCEHLLLETIQRSRSTRSDSKETKKTSKKFPSINKFIKKTQFDTLNTIIFKKVDEMEAYLIQLDCGGIRNHKMRQRYDQCKCCPTCPFKLKINICLSFDLIQVFHERNAVVGCISKNGIKIKKTIDIFSGDISIYR